MRATIWSVVAMLTLGALSLLWFLSTHTRVSEREPVWPRAAARQNPYLAASELLRQYQLPVRQVQTLEGPLAPQPGSVLLVSARRGLLSARAVAHLTAATEAGAHLVVEAEIADERDPLLDAFGIERIEGEYPYRYGSRDWASRLESDPEDAEELVEVPWDQDAPLRVHLEQTVQLNSVASPEWSLGVESDIRALHLRVGRGQLTVVSDLGFLSYWGTGRIDHAELFWPSTPSRLPQVFRVRYELADAVCTFLLEPETQARLEAAFLTHGSADLARAFDLLELARR